MNTATNLRKAVRGMRRATSFCILHSAFCIAFAALCAASAYAAPELSFEDDTISVTVPADTVTTNSALHLCWGASDAGANPSDWSHSACLTADGVTATGGTWTASAAARGVATGDAIRAIIVGPIPFWGVEYVETPATVSPGKGGDDPAPNNKTLGVYTGVDAKTGLHVKTRMRWLALADSEFCGGRYTSSDSKRIFPIHTYRSNWLLGYGGLTAGTNSCSANTDYVVESKLYQGRQTMSVNGTQIYELHDNSEVHTEGECIVFGAYYTASTLNHLKLQAHARCYYLKMWENGNTSDNPEGDLVRDYVPVKAADGRGALYDKVSGAVFAPVSFGTETPQRLVVGDETGEIYHYGTGTLASSILRHYLVADIAATVGSGQVAVTVEPEIIVGVTNVLVVCWGDHDYGDQAADWPNVLSEQYAVGQAGGTFVFPAAEIAEGSSVRAFLVKDIRLADYISSVDNSSANAITVYFDTGVEANHGVRVQTRIEWLERWEDFGFMGVRYDNGNSRFILIHGYKNGQWGLGYGVGHWNNGVFNLDTPYEVEAKLYAGEQRLTVDGVDKYAGDDSSVRDYGRNLFAFAVNWYRPQPGTPQYGCRAKCYYLKMYTGGDKTTNPDGTLVRDYLPAVVDGVAGMYDRANRTFTVSAGANAFRYGSVTNTIGNTDVTYLASGLAAETASGEDEPPSGFAFTFSPSLDGGTLSLAANFSYASTGSRPLNSFNATLEAGGTVVTGAIDWVARTIAFPSVSVAADIDAVFTLAYGEGTDERYSGLLPVRLGTSDWFSSTASAMDASGVWIGASAQGGRIAAADGAAYVPNSSAVADLRVVELSGIFGTTTGTEADAPDSKFGVEIREVDGTNRFAVVAGGTWRVVPSVVADPAATCSVRVELDAVNGTIAYYAAGADGLAAFLGRYANQASADVVSRIAFGGAASLDSLRGSRRGLARDYAFNASLDGRWLTVAIDGDTVTNGNTSLYICYDQRDRGEDLYDWAGKLFVAGPLPPTGGVYRVNLAAAGVRGEIVRPFLARAMNVEVLASLTATATVIDTPRIFTGVPAKSGARVVTRMSWDNKNFNGGDQSFFAAKQKPSNSDRLMLIHCYPRKWGLGYVDGHWGLGEITDSQVCEVESKCYAGYQELTVDGVTLYTGSDSTEIDLSPADFAVFACNYRDPDQASQQNGGTGLHGCATCYGMKVYVNGDQATNPDGDLARDFVPARYHDQLGLWDKENEQFHPGEGGGFTGGGVVSVIETGEYHQFAVSAAIRRHVGLFIYIK